MGLGERLAFKYGICNVLLSLWESRALRPGEGFDVFKQLPDFPEISRFPESCLGDANSNAILIHSNRTLPGPERPTLPKGGCCLLTSDIDLLATAIFHKPCPSSSLRNLQTLLLPADSRTKDVRDLTRRLRIPDVNSPT
jgi:hypothetical protein